MIVEKFVTDQQMDGWTDRQADGRTDGWMDGRENRQSLLDLQFSLQNRTVFHILYKKLIPERKKNSGTLFSLYAAHRAFQILVVVVEFWIFQPFHFGWQ